MGASSPTDSDFHRVTTAKEGIRTANLIKSTHHAVNFPECEYTDALHSTIYIKDDLGKANADCGE